MTSLKYYFHVQFISLFQTVSAACSQVIPIPSTPPLGRSPFWFSAGSLRLSSGLKNTSSRSCSVTVRAVSITQLQRTG
ncbi:hypothetical protein B0H13DRAFT_1955045, partial [Mycena leptocephala]